MTFILNFLIGIFIGFGAILPGVSSGVFCVVFGIYEKLVDSIIHFFKNIRSNILFLLPIGIGTFLGILLFGNVIKYIFFNYKVPSCFAFMGLILGTIPSLFTEININKCITIKKFLPLIISFLIGILFVVCENTLNLNNINLSIASTPIYLIFAGIIMSMGIIIPGISNTILLMCLGVYPSYISAIASMNFHILVPLGIGIVIGSLLWLQIINKLLNKHHEKTYLSIIGFTLGSLFVLYPGFTFNLVGFLSLILFILCSVFSYKITNCSIQNLP